MRIRARTRLMIVTAAVILLPAARATSVARADLTPPQMHTVAGHGGCTTPVLTTFGTLTLPCNGVAAKSVPINVPTSVATLPDGSYLYVDSQNDLVQEVGPDGTVTTVAGTGPPAPLQLPGDGPDGVPAINSELDNPVAVAPLPGGGFLITEVGSLVDGRPIGSVIRLVSAGPPGVATITTIAGTGNAGNQGDPVPGGPPQPATSAELSHPSDAEPLPDGRVLIVDTGNEDIKLLSAAAPGATVTTIAGSGPCDDTLGPCDGMAASSVTLNDPVAVSPLPDGSGGYLIAEFGADAIDRVSGLDPSSAFTTVAGTPGTPGFAGDGGPATRALLTQPQGVTSTPDGGFLIADTGNNRIRQVSASGTITTFAGNGVATFNGDSGAATDASLFEPTWVSPWSNGSFLIADAANNAIRAVTLAATTTIKLPPLSGTNGWYDAPVKVSATATQGAGTKCAFDPPQAPTVYGELLQSCKQTIATDGTHTIYAASKNSYGDLEAPISVTLKVDTTSPMVTCASTPTFTYGAPGAHLVSAATDTGGSGPVQALTLSPVDDHVLGRRWIIVTVYDLAGNPGGQVCYYNVVPRKLSPAPVLQWKFAPGRASSKVTTLAVSHVPKSATVGVVCHGKGCPFASKRFVRAHACHGSRCQGAGTTVDLRALFARSRLSVRAGLTVTVTAKGTIGQAFLLGVRSRRQPSYRAACLAPGATTKPGQRC